MAQANIKAVITADDRASDTLRRFGHNADNALGGIAKGVAAVGIAAAAVTAGLVAFGVSSVKSFQESEESLSQLNAVLASTGGVAGVTAEAATELADSLQKVTKFSDEDVIAAENLLLTFTKIGKDIFPEATKTVLDMSTALGQDTKSSAIQLGKALQDPILGVTALRRVGVNFNSAQQDVIKNLVETGRSAEAQRLILKELATEFGGSAEAAGKTFGGRLEILKNQFDEVKERIGSVIVDAIGPLADRLANFIATEEFRLKVEALVNWLEINLPIAIAKIEEFVRSVDWKQVVENTIAITNAFITMGTFIGQTIENIRNAQEQFIAIGGAVLFAWQSVLRDLNSAFRQTRDGIVSDFNAIKDFLTGIPGWVKAAFGGLAAAMVAPFIGAFTGIVSLWNNTVGRISFKFPEWVPGLGGKSISVPKFASGTDYFSGGNAIVGERGPEMVTLPRGSKIHPANETSKMGGGTTVNVTVQAGAFMGSHQDARKYAQIIADALKDVAKMNGTTVGSMLA